MSSNQTPAFKFSAQAAAFVPQTTTPVSQAGVAAQAMLNIVAAGCDQFEKEHNRPMTYSEMRARFG